MATVMNVNHFSIYLKRNMECTVILPSDMKNDEKLPVLWLYHGSSGDNTVWLYHSPIAEYVDEGRFAAVQNMNLLFGFEENEGLKIAPMFP